MKVIATTSQLAGDAHGFLLRSGASVVFTGAHGSPDELKTFVAREQPDAIISRTWRITPEVMDASGKLRLICKHGVGVDNIDVAAATQRGIPVVNTPGTNTLSVAELALTLILCVLKGLPWVDSRMRVGNWEKPSYRGFELSGKRLGIVGLGAIGRELIRLTRPFGVAPIAYDPAVPPAIFDEVGVECADTLDDLLAAADIISLHCPLTEENRGLIGRAELTRCKPSAILINTARGALVDPSALVDALRENRLAGAGLDAFSDEPLPADSPLTTLDNVVLTPHVGGATVEGMERVAMAAARTVVDYLKGNPLDPRCVLNPTVLGRGTH